MAVACNIEETMQLLSRKWTLMIIKALIDHGRLRYTELAGSLNGISPKTLSDRLKELKQVGIVRRKSFAEIPPRVEYSLTEKGIELGESLSAIVDWSVKWGS
ncbi:MAG TPA: transcriptional regulator [Euryarchaeota archaeon]|nr:putative HTH-type transcriptional regulator YtcD [archaeon BMS3Abin16]GBE57069.1 putative HTH-type transcriptional regulator YtcD [archaeon BMS3Bbin16]HDH28041.1 transcriptional regulator [Euryarchaeota archaeon]